MEAYLLTALVLIVSTVIVVVFWLKSKGDGINKPTATTVQHTAAVAPTKVPTLNVQREPSPVEEVNALDDTPREKPVVWEDIPGVQVIEVDYTDHSDEHEEHNEQELHEENKMSAGDKDQVECQEGAQTQPEEEVYEYDENFEEQRESQNGGDESEHFDDEADYRDESPRNSESGPAPLSLDASHTDQRSPKRPTLAAAGRTLSKDAPGSLSPMNYGSGKTLYKFGSHYKKGGDSWIVNQNAEATAAAASPVGVSPVRATQLKKIIPVHNDAEPLARRQSNKISQYEAGLDQEKQKISSRVLETRRRNIQDVVNRVILDGDAAKVLPAEIDPIVLLVDPTVDVKTKKIVKQMTVKFSAAAGVTGASAGAAEESECGVGGADSTDVNGATGELNATVDAASDGVTTSSEKSDVAV